MLMTGQQPFLKMDTRSLAILAIVVSLGGGSGAFINSQLLPRQPEDVVTHNDLLDVQMRMQKEFELRMLRMELALRADMPPEPTRARIAALEAGLEKVNPNFTPPTSRWSHVTPGGQRNYP